MKEFDEPFTEAGRALLQEIQGDDEDLRLVTAVEREAFEAGQRDERQAADSAMVPLPDNAALREAMLDICGRIDGIAYRGEHFIPRGVAESWAGTLRAALAKTYPKAG